MLLWRLCTSAAGLAAIVAAQSSSQDLPNYSTISGASTVSNPSATIPTGDYVITTGQITLATNIDLSSTVSATGNSSQSSTGTGTSTSTGILIVGQNSTATATNGTATSSTTSATVTNTQPCNSYAEFCNRKYSNITEVAAHNAAMVKKNNAFSNQDIPILGQLNDGIRMIQGEVHYVNGSLWNCHSNCNFLNTGLYEDTLVTIRRWLEANPYEVVTLLIVNSNYANVTAFATAFENSGILDYIYLPSKRPMQLNDWPTLGEMILQNTRVVAMMDYEANPDLVPYIMDEFSNMWETPFSPTDINFPCTQQRPPGLSTTQAKDDYLYLANHNLNVELSLGGSDILIPNFAQLNLVNANNESTGALLNMTQGCDSMWDRPPKWLLVDFYNTGNFPGSVFAVAARFNNVTYNPASCCGKSVDLTAAAARLSANRWTLTVAALLMSFVIGVITL